jgi:hypothetical protein
LLRQRVRPRLSSFTPTSRRYTLPAIFAFLGYDPFPEPKTLPEQLLAKRREMGWPITQAAQAIGVDPDSWRNWERGQLILYRRHRLKVSQLLGLDEMETDREMRNRWGHLHPHSPNS